MGKKNISQLKPSTRARLTKDDLKSAPVEELEKLIQNVRQEGEKAYDDMMQLATKRNLPMKNDIEKQVDFFKKSAILPLFRYIRYLPEEKYQKWSEKLETEIIELDLKAGEYRMNKDESHLR